VQERARLAKYISLVNLLACREIDRRSATKEKVPFPEYLTCDDESHNIAKDIIRWLRDEPRRLETVQQLFQLRANYAHAGASRRAADYICRHLQPASNSTPRPHFRPRRPTSDLSIR
jgi:lipid A disaccharide synthetase